MARAKKAKSPTKEQIEQGFRDYAEPEWLIQYLNGIVAMNGHEQSNTSQKVTLTLSLGQLGYIRDLIQDDADAFATASARFTNINNTVTDQPALDAEQQARYDAGFTPDEIV